MVGTTSRRFIRHYAISTDVSRDGRCRNTNVCGDIEDGQSTGYGTLRAAPPRCWPIGRCCTRRRLDGKSRMSGDVHVRICERLGVKLPRATRLVIGFEHKDDAQRFLDAMRDRLGEFALSLHPAKTRLIEFGRFATTDRKRRGLGKPETFTFLGFTFICGRSRRGTFVLQRKTRRDRMRRKLKDIKVELQRRMHQPIPEQGKWLSQVVTGHFAYYAVPTNSRALSAFRRCVTDLWRRTLRRRSQRDGFTWERMAKLVSDWLPPPRILHPWPDIRFDVKHPR